MENANEAIIGISPGNPYFTEARLTSLLKRATAEYGHVTIMIPDTPAIHTYRALGYALNKAREKAISKGGNAIRNRLDRVLPELGEAAAKVRVLDWEKDVAGQVAYKAAHRRICALYNCSDAFNAAVSGATAEVLENKSRYHKRNIADMSSAVQEGGKYLLAELAFLDAADQILGVPQPTYIYHNPWPVFEHLIKGGFDGKKRGSTVFREMPQV